MSQKPKREKAKIQHAHAPASEITALAPSGLDKSAAPTTSRTTAMESKSGESKSGESKSGFKAETGAATASQPQVDGWFDRQLVDLYGEVAEEPVPDELLALINQLKDPN